MAARLAGPRILDTQWRRKNLEPGVTALLPPHPPMSASLTNFVSLPLPFASMTPGWEGRCGVMPK